MATFFRIKQIYRGVLLVIVALFGVHLSEAETACALVKMEIRQEVTLERQGFEATLTVDNGLGVNLDNFTVTVWMKEAGEAEFLTRAPNTPNNTEDLEFFRNSASTELFFFRPAQNETAVTINAQGSRTFTYLLIPTQEAALTADGTSYAVGAYITYNTAGQAEQSIEVEPDSILVKPLPALTLEYFLPKSVLADNPNTAKVEASEPFELGVRVVNSGVGNAQGLHIESFQPKVQDNPQGLLIDFKIVSSAVNGKAAEPNLTADFGELLAGHAEVASWQMFSTLYGRFIDAQASFTHSDELGGAVTSLIEDASVYRFVGTVQSNADGIPDFLSLGQGSSKDALSDTDFRFSFDEDFKLKLIGNGPNRADFLYLHPSGLQGDGSVGSRERLPVANLSNFTVSSGGLSDALTVAITSAPSGLGGVNYSFIRVPDPRRGRYAIDSVQRQSDQGFLPRANFSLSTELAENPDGTINETADFEYYIDIFDIGNVAGDGAYTTTYTIDYGAAIETNTAPVIVPLPNLPLLAAGELVEFTVEAFDLDGDPVELSASTQPADADFVKNTASSDVSRAVYEFTWTAQAGASVLSIVASDGVDSVSASMNFNVLAAVDLAAWLDLYMLNESDLSTDSDRDGYNALLEYVLNLNPDERSTAGLPQVFVQEVDGQSHLALRCDVVEGVLLDGSEIVLSAVVSDESEGGTWTEITTYTAEDSPTPGMARIVWVDMLPLADAVERTRFIKLKAEYSPAQ